MFDVGYLTVARWQGTPIRVHWTTPLGMLAFGRFAFVPGIWLGYLLIVTLHEMGHALLSRRQGLTAMSIEIHAFGGQCRYGGASISAWQRSVIAWGGVLAQAVLLAIALPLQLLAPLPPIAFVHELLYALVSINLMIMALNLIPFPPLDGAEAWKIVRLWRERRGRRAVRAARDRVEVRARMPRRPAGDPDAPLDLGDVDQEKVRETVRRALSDAARSSRRKDVS
jgi:Zn-dependent protease